jgi:hypothetical protein
MYCMYIYAVYIMLNDQFILFDFACLSELQIVIMATMLRLINAKMYIYSLELSYFSVRTQYRSYRGA